MATHKALGRGLDALFTSTPAKPIPAMPSTSATATEETAVPQGEVRDIPVSAIKPNRHQPRTYFDPAALEELSASIRLHGLAQPLLVTETAMPGEYELVVGERRLRASKLAGLETVPCTIKRLTNRERFEIALIENLQRQDLNAMEEAVALAGLMKEYDLTQDQVASAIGKSRSSVANVLRLLKLHEDIQDALRAGKITEGHAKCLAGLAEHSEQLRFLEKILKENLSVRDLEALLTQGKPSTRLKTAAVSTRSPEVVRYEDYFQKLLGRRVEIKTEGKKGWLKLEFYSPTDLDTLCKKLGLLTDENAPRF